MAMNDPQQQKKSVSPQKQQSRQVKKFADDHNRSRTFQEYIDQLRELDKDQAKSKEYGSILILGLAEEVGEIARAYLAEHGRKPQNKAAQRDETYKQELGDLLISIMRVAIEKNINLDHRIQYTLKKIRQRKSKPKQ
jgi:NTP pyrophosphatase (non-canonical NTP hydrolase)